MVAVVIILVLDRVQDQTEVLEEVVDIQTKQVDQETHLQLVHHKVMMEAHLVHQIVDLVAEVLELLEAHLPQTQRELVEMD